VTLRLRADVSMVDTDGAAVLLDQRTGRYFQLNETGAAIVRDLLDGRSTDATARRLAARHPVAAERALADITGLLSQLSDAHLVDE
jgi:hypothetical protein